MNRFSPRIPSVNAARACGSRQDPGSQAIRFGCLRVRIGGVMADRQSALGTETEAKDGLTRMWYVKLNKMGLLICVN